MNIQHELRLISRGAIYSFLGNGFSVILDYLLIILMTRLSGVKSVGLYLLAITIINVLAVIVRLGLSEGVLRYVAISRTNKNMSQAKGMIFFALCLTFITSLVVAILLVTFSNRLALILNCPEIVSIIKLFALSLPFVATFKIIISAFQAYHQMQNIVRFQGITLPLTLIFSYLTLRAMQLGNLSIGVAFIFSYILICTWSIKELMGFFREDIRPDYTKCIQMVKFSIPLALVGLLLLTYGQVDTLFLGWYSGFVEVGIFGVALKLSLLCSAVFVSTNYLFAPIIAELFHCNEINKLDTIFKSVTRWVITVSLPIYFIIFINYTSILSFFGKEYLLGKTTLFILCFGQLINFSTGAVGTVLTMVGKSYLSLINSAFCLIINIILDYLLIPKYGITGAALAVTISLVIINLIRFIQVVWLIKIYPYSSRIFIPILTIVALTILVLLLRRMFATGIAISIIYTVLSLSMYALIMIYTIHEDDKEMFYYIIDRTYSKMRNHLSMIFN